MEINKLQNLKKEIYNKRAELEQLSFEKKMISKQEGPLRTEVMNIQSKINLLKGKQNILASDHALLRYLEREHGVDMKVVSTEMITKPLKELIIMINGNGKVTFEGIQYVIRNYTIVTLYPV